MTKNMKTCSRCNRTKPICYFSNDSNTPDGLSYQCSDCRHAHYVANRSKILKRMHGPDYRPNRQVYNSRQRAKRYDVENTLTVSEWKERLANSDGCCAYCGEKVGQAKLVIDHIMPMLRGGFNSIENIVPACKSCNRRKATKSSEQFLKELEWERILNELPEIEDHDTVAMLIRRLSNR